MTPEANPNEVAQGRLREYVGSRLERAGRSRPLRKASQVLASFNVLHWSTALGPLKFYLIGFFVGVGLLVFSVAVGVASFSVNVEIETLDGEKIARTLDLG